MKAKVARGGGFRGLLDYVLNEDKTPDLVAGTLAGDNPRDLAREFGAVRRLRPDISRPVWHCSLALPSGERLDADKWDAVAVDFMGKMGFPADTTPWVAVRHNDTDHEHAHVVASRIGTNGSVWLGQWEARKAIEATQALERSHGLTITPGLGDARAERRTLSGKEINRAVRCGQEPPRQRLQGLLAEAVQGKPGALEFAERLVAAGVTVRANIATTGKINGFSFAVDGVAFKASNLGKKYSWQGLQRAGVKYVETNDRAGLERLRAAADRRERPEAAEQRPDAAGERPDDGARAASTSGRDIDRDLGGAGPARESPRRSADGAGALRHDSGGPAAVPGSDGRGHGRESGEDVRAAGGKAGHDADRREDQRDEPAEDGQAGDDTSRGAGGSPDTIDPRGRPADRRGEQGAPAMVAPGAGADFGRSHGRGPTRDWSLRFRQARAARRASGAGAVARNVSPGHPRRARVTARDRASARSLDPAAFLEQHGYSVKLTGKNLSVRTDGNELYRLTHRGNRWLWYDRYGNAGGDNIALVRELQPNCGYAEAVFQLLGAPSVRRRPPPPPREPLKLPESQARVDAGHQKQAARIAGITGQDTGHWSPDPAQSGSSPPRHTVAGLPGGSP